jgi:lipopolysaccharide heptosyltransferase I
MAHDLGGLAIGGFLSPGISLTIELVHLLIVKLGSIGDIVHTLPSLAAIRAAMPTAQISWAVEQRSAELLRGNRLIDNLIEIDTRRLREGMSADEMLSSIREQVRGLRSFKCDIAIDFQGLLKSAAIAKLSGAKQRWGFTRAGLREPLSRVLLTDTVAAPPALHVIRKNLALVAGALNIDVPADDPEFPITTLPAHRAEARGIVSGLASDSFAILNPGGGWVTKLWPAENFGRLADALWETTGMTSVLTTGPGEEGLAAAALAGAKAGSLSHAQPTLKAFFELVRNASLYVGGDTGPTHIAVAAGAPVVGLFGPTEWWRNGSPGPADICVERTDIGCRTDCHRRSCSKWICMDISVETVLSACLTRLDVAAFRRTPKAVAVLT